MSVTRFGVSLLKVVATIDSPASHQGTARPEAKNSAVLLPPRRATCAAGMKQRAPDPTAISQSSTVSRMRADCIRLCRERLRGRAEGGESEHRTRRAAGRGAAIAVTELPTAL